MEDKFRPADKSCSEIYDFSSIVDPKAVLKGKSVLFAGDSITEGYMDEPGKGGWAQRIGEANEMNWINHGMAGSCFTCGLDIPEIIRQITPGNYDYIILNGGTNDALYCAPIGDENQDQGDFMKYVGTFAGAFKLSLEKIKERYPDTKIGYITSYRTPHSEWGGRTRNPGPYFDKAKEICRELKIPVLDLYDGCLKTEDGILSISEDILKTDTPEYLANHDAGEIHIGFEGYDLLSPIIEKWMAAL